MRRWPAPVVDAIEQAAADQAHRWSAWGHRKIWAMLRADGVRVSRSSVLRALARRDLLLPVRYQAERRQLAVARRELFVEPRARRNRVWQTDFTEYETSRGGTWRVAPVVDYATKLCLADPVSGTTSARDAIRAVEAAIDEAERLLGHPLLHDCVDPDTGGIEPLTIVTDVQTRCAPIARGQAWSWNDAGSGSRPPSLSDRVERPPTPGLLITLAGGASAGGRIALLGTR